MQQLLVALKALITGFQLCGGVCFIFCLLRIGYKLLLSPNKRDEIKIEAICGIVGLILVLGCFPLGEYVQSLINF